MRAIATHNAIFTESCGLASIVAGRRCYSMLSSHCSQSSVRVVHRRHIHKSKAKSAMAWCSRFRYPCRTRRQRGSYIPQLRICSWRQRRHAPNGFRCDKDNEGARYVPVARAGIAPAAFTPLREAIPRLRMVVNQNSQISQMRSSAVLQCLAERVVEFIEEIFLVLRSWRGFNSNQI